MKTQFVLTASSILLLQPSTSDAFSPQSMARRSSSSRTVNPTRSQIMLERKAHAVNSEEEALFLMAKANACAHSETCSIDEAEAYLEEIIHIQSGCVTGSFASEQVCENIDFPNEVISALRQKIESSAKTPTAALNVRSMMSPIFLTMFMIYLSSSIISMNQHQPGVDTFTAQEVWWSIRDGYAPTMFAQFLKNGGLASVENTDTVVLPFTPAEWWWATRDGYLGNMIGASMKNGGLEMSMVELGDTPITTPFLAEEWGHAVKDGYLGDMISHYMRNGGL